MAFARWFLLALISTPCFAQSTPTVRGTLNDSKYNYIYSNLNNYLLGRSTVTGIPNFQGGLNVSGTSNISGATNISGESRFTAPATFASTALFDSTASWSANFRYSTTTVPETAYNNSSFGICAASVTLTSNGGAVQIWFSGGIYQQGGAAMYSSSFLINNNATNTTTYPGGTSGTVGLAIDTYDSSGGYQTGNLSWAKTIKPPAGTYTYCVTAYGVSLTFCASTYVSCEFGAREIQ